jgi:hypothetical protein
MGCIVDILVQLLLSQLDIEQELLWRSLTVKGIKPL